MANCDYLSEGQANEPWNGPASENGALTPFNVFIADSFGRHCLIFSALTPAKAEEVLEAAHKDLPIADGR